MNDEHDLETTGQKIVAVVGFGVIGALVIIMWILTQK